MRVAVVACILLLLAGCSTSPPVLHERSLQMGPEGEGFAEVNLLMRAGQSVSWAWTATGGELYFNVHSHVGANVTDHVQKVAAADEGTFTAPAEGSYSLLWENLGKTAAVLHYRVTGDAGLDPAHPPTP